MKTLLLAVCLLFSSACSSAEISKKEGIEINSTISMFLQSLRIGDKEIALSLISDDWAKRIGNPYTFVKKLTDEKSPLVFNDFIFFKNVYSENKKGFLIPVIVEDSFGKTWNLMFVIKRGAFWNIDEIYVMRSKQHTT